MEHLPPWLRNLPLPSRPGTDPAAAASASAQLSGNAPAPPVAPEADDVPDWLRDLQQDQSIVSPDADTAGADEGMPDWLSDTIDDDQGTDDEPTTSSRVKLPVGPTDWLRSIGQDPDAEEAPEKPRVPEKAELRADNEPESGVPDWLKDLTDLETDDIPSVAEEEGAIASSSQPAAAPDWLADVAPVTPEDDTVGLDEPAVGEGIPDWLRDIGVGSSDPPSISESRDLPTYDDDMPDWLRGDAPPPPAPDVPEPVASADDDMPDWLRGDAPPPAPGAPEPVASADDDMPDWLRGDAPPPPPAPGVPEPVASADDDMPDWLRGDAPPPAPGVPEPVASADDDMPDWLRGDAPPPAPGVPEPVASADDDMPDWLRGDAPPPAPGVPEPVASADDDMPDWLRGDAPPPPPAPGAPEPVASADDDMPDWLRGDAPPPAPGVPEPVASADDDMPDWLRGDAPPPASGVPEPVASADDDMPDWLRGDAPPPAPGVPEPVASADDDMPDWLRGDAPPPPAPGVPEPVASADDDMPDWLRGDAPPPPAPGVPEPVASADDGMPDWLRGDAPPAPETTDSQNLPAWLAGDAEADRAETPAAAAEDVPDWIREMEAPAAPPPTTDAPAADVPVVAEDSPAWLREMEAPSAEQVSSAPDSGVPTADDMPDWLRGDAAPASEPATPAADDMPDWLQGDAAPASEPATPAADEDLPPWLNDSDTADDVDIGTASSGLPSWLSGESSALEEPPPEVPTSPTPPPPTRRTVTAAEDAEGNDFLSGADLPDWLRASEAERPTESEAGQTLDWLRKLGSVDSDDTETSLPQPGAVTLHRPTYERSGEQIEAIGLLKQIVAAPFPASAAPSEAPAPDRWTQFGIDRILYIVVLLALLVGLLVPSLGEPLQGTAPEAPGADELRTLIETLGPDDVVLVAYEWGAQRSAELRPLENAVTSQLIDQQIKLILVSTDLQGSILSFNLIQPLRTAGYNIDPDGRILGGRDYVLLGYQPGGDLALRSLARDLRNELRSDFEGQDATQGLLATRLDRTERISSIHDLGMILVMADSPQDVQAWMEQVHREAPEVPIAFLVPRETQPLAQPYFRLPNVYHLAGSQGAIAFDADGNATNQTGAQLPFAILVFVIVLIGGGLTRLILHMSQSRRGKP